MVYCALCAAILHVVGAQHIMCAAYIHTAVCFFIIIPFVYCKRHGLAVLLAHANDLDARFAYRMRPDLNRLHHHSFMYNFP